MTQTMRDVLTYGDASLRRRADPVLVFDKDLGLLLDEMVAVMEAHEGVGLSANQIGSPEAACVIKVKGELIEMVNPQIIDASEPVTVSEACLSIPGWADSLERWGVLVGTAQDREGNAFKFRATHLKAQVIQHECDHLGAILFTDRVLNQDFQRWIGFQESWTDDDV